MTTYLFTYYHNQVPPSSLTTPMKQRLILGPYLDSEIVDISHINEPLPLDEVLFLQDGHIIGYTLFFICFKLHY